MVLSRTAGVLSLSAAVCGCGLWLMQAQEEPQYLVDHSDCAYFGAAHERFAHTGLKAPLTPPSQRYRSSNLTRVVTSAMSRPIETAAAQPVSANTIDKYIFGALNDAGVTPAPTTTDAEFIRRVSLDLTGKIPTASRVVSFVNDQTPNKRANLIEELMGRYEWIDKWTMFFGDLYQNVSNTAQINRYPEGRDAFNAWIKNSLAANMPYDQMVRTLIVAKGANTFTQGELNWVVSGRVTGGPSADTWDQQAVNVASTFLGLSNLNCLLCHNGRGHLDTLNLWASQTTRSTAWQMSAFFTQGMLTQYRSDDKTKNPWWGWGPGNKNQTPGYYALGSTTGNRPPRTPPVPTNTKISPTYIFSGHAPQSSDDYQAFLANEVTSDFQFARAAVNYIWEQFFTLALVTPSNQFDLARLDPDNPPPAPWTLQPTNPRLLNALAQDFISSHYDLKGLMREIANSQAYQLSSRYDPSAWDDSWEPLFARKLVRRLWAEEVHDSVAQATNMIPTYKINDFGSTSWAMQFPEPRGIPGGAVGYFLDSFERGNRDDQQRRGDGSILQALSLLNDNFIMSRTKSSGSGATASLMTQSLNMTDSDMIRNFYLNVLSRYPTQDETSAAMTLLGSGNRQQKAQDLLWSLFNKVDFIYNY